MEKAALLNGGQVAEVTVLLRNRAATHRETWYYRLTPQGWRHTATGRVPLPLTRPVARPAWHEAMLDYTIRPGGDGGAVVIRYRGVGGGQKLLRLYRWPMGGLPPQAPQLPE